MSFSGAVSFRPVDSMLFSPLLTISSTDHEPIAHRNISPNPLDQSEEF
jgi:hypothetical protein